MRAELPSGAAVGETITAAVTLTSGEGYHVYALGEAGANAVPTSFTTSPVGLEPAGGFAATTAPEEHEKAGDVLREHHGAVTFEAPFTVTAEDYGLAGTVTYQACTDSFCLRPAAVPFSLGTTEATPAAVPGEPETPAGVELAEEFAVADNNPLAAWGLWAVFPAAFLAGLALNVMPCVLPVIAIKVMSFVQQAGESRAAVLTLNLWYTLGVLAVFMTFAALSLGAGALLGGADDFTWGEHLNSPAFKIGMTALVFAMALSMLGVYEIPVPGFVGSAAGSSAGQKEGRDRRVPVRRVHDAAGDALHGAADGPGAGLRRHAGQPQPGRQRGRLVRDGGGVRQPVPAVRADPGGEPVPPAAGELDGAVQGVRRAGAGRHEPVVDERAGLLPLAAGAGRPAGAGDGAVGPRPADRPQRRVR